MSAFFPKGAASVCSVVRLGSGRAFATLVPVDEGASDGFAGGKAALDFAMCSSERASRLGLKLGLETPIPQNDRS